MSALNTLPLKSSYYNLAWYTRTVLSALPLTTWLPPHHAAHSTCHNERLQYIVGIFTQANPIGPPRMLVKGLSSTED